MNSQGLIKSNPQNTTEARHNHNYSTFDKSLSYLFANTLRFGEVTPSFCMEGVEKDSIQLNSLDKIDSLSLNGPFKSQIRKIKSSFKVPYMAILPHNWDRIYVQPANGDDVPADANCVLEDFPAKYSSFWSNLLSLVRNNIPGSTGTAQDFASWLTALCRMLVLGEYVYSYGSLLHVCGYKLAGTFNHYAYGYTDERTYDDFFDRIINYTFNAFKSLVLCVPEEETLTFKSYTVRCFASDAGGTSPTMITVRAMLDMIRENPLSYFSGLSQDVNVNDSISTLAGLSTYLGVMADSSAASSYPLLGNAVIDVNATHVSPDDLTDMHPGNLNLSRVLAYQLCCHHFMSNSAVDFIYTAELFRSYVYALERLRYSAYPGPFASLSFFSWNGTSYPFDSLSGHLLERCSFCNNNGVSVTLAYNELSGVDPGSINSLYIFSILAAVFSYRRSLRYADYFVGSRPRPLAPINTDVSVNNSAVSVIDITKKIQAQRFANGVMRSRSKIEEYVESLFGKKPDVDFHNPLYLSEEVETIYGDEVQNTAEAQVTVSNSRTANFANGLGRYTFTFHNDDMHPCVYIQLISFDVRRAYTRSIDRQFFIADRYDMFNPDFQYIGDQPVYGMELGYHNVGAFIPDVFAYQTRDAEYKQRFDVASGAFANNRLPGWIVTDQDQSKFSKYVLDADFIRNYSAELDKFFLSLSGYSLGHYFHFALLTQNNVNAKRAMAVDPQILG